MKPTVWPTSTLQLFCNQTSPQSKANLSQNYMHFWLYSIPIRCTSSSPTYYNRKWSPRLDTTEQFQFCSQPSRQSRVNLPQNYMHFMLYHLLVKCTSSSHSNFNPKIQTIVSLNKYVTTCPQSRANLHKIICTSGYTVFPLYTLPFILYSHYTYLCLYFIPPSFFNRR